MLLPNLCTIKCIMEPYQQRSLKLYTNFMEVHFPHIYCKKLKLLINQDIHVKENHALRYCFYKKYALYVFSSRCTKSEVFHCGFLQEMWLNPQFSLDLVTFTEETLIESFIFCAVSVSADCCILLRYNNLKSKAIYC